MAHLMNGALLRGLDSPHFKCIRERETNMNIRQKISQFAKFQRTVRELNQLDNRQLADIGIRRENIAALAREHFN
jgi:uncharacterized protein YjiS (DUF1127 family)